MEKFKIQNSKFKIIVFILLFTFHFSLFTFSAYAHDDNLGEARIHPASPLYFLKSVREILELKFAGATHIRALRNLEFTTRRIREVKSLVKTSRQDLIEPTLERYWATLSELKGLVNLKDEITVSQVSGAAASQMAALQDIYYQVSDPRAKRSLRTAINRVSEWEQQMIVQLNLFKQYSQAQQVMTSKLSACNFLAQEASNSALNEVEKTVWSQRAQKCLTPTPN
ncbi:hypothetical protein HYU94_04050 [Candidatus Daviesbacteria bacterium]|nr:hypothetical protein [Candidatus Daviesbacteria bacterium]